MNEAELKNINAAKNIFLDIMLKEGLILPESHGKMVLDYYIDIKKPTHLHSFWRKVLGKERAENYQFIVSKQLTFSPDADANEPNQLFKIVEFSSKEEE